MAAITCQSFPLSFRTVDKEAVKNSYFAREKKISEQLSRKRSFTGFENAAEKGGTFKSLKESCSWKLF